MPCYFYLLSVIWDGSERTLLQLKDPRTFKATFFKTPLFFFRAFINADNAITNLKCKAGKIDANFMCWSKNWLLDTIVTPPSAVGVPTPQIPKYRNIGVLNPMIQWSPNSEFYKNTTLDSPKRFQLWTW